MFLRRGHSHSGATADGGGGVSEFEGRRGVGGRGGGIGRQVEIRRGREIDAVNAHGAEHALGQLLFATTLEPRRWWPAVGGNSDR